MTTRLLLPAACALAILVAGPYPANATAPIDPALRAGHPQSAQTAQESKARDTKASNAQAFVTEAAHGGHAEVSLGKLASEKAASNDVKEFGQMMVKDHSKANDELATLAGRKGLDVPDGPAKKQKAEEERLSRLSGAQFDRAYMQLMVKDHEKDVRAFEQASRQLDDAELKRWASQTLPTLREHLDRARAIQASLGETSSARR
jgi:putative membrane protein